MRDRGPGLRGARSGREDQVHDLGLEVEADLVGHLVDLLHSRRLEHLLIEVDGEGEGRHERLAVLEAEGVVVEEAEGQGDVLDRVELPRVVDLENAPIVLHVAHDDDPREVRELGAAEERNVALRVRGESSVREPDDAPVADDRSGAGAGYRENDRVHVASGALTSRIFTSAAGSSSALPPS